MQLQCDETQPACGYCSLRKLTCEYPHDVASAARSPSPSSSSEEISLASSDPVEEVDFNDTSIQLPGWVLPATNTSIGQFTHMDYRLLDHYKSFTWRTFAMRGEGMLDHLHRDTIPKLSIAYPFLLNAILGMAAAHSNYLNPSKEMQNQALVYRQRTFEAYRNALQGINADNYEAILVTGLYLGALVPRPQEFGESTEDCLTWMFSMLKLNEGLRILAGLQWGSGIEKLSVFPMLRRELHPLPPPPVVTAPNGAPIPAPSGPLGTTPDFPNPPSTYDTIHVLASMDNTIFLPPCLMDLLVALMASSKMGQFDLDRETLKPAVYAFSPIFSSLYHYHLNQDFYVRIFAFTTHLTSDFMQLVKTREPRAFALLSWRFSLATLVPQGWWAGGNLRKVITAIGSVVIEKGDAVSIRVYHKALNIWHLVDTQGREQAAKSIFEDWEGVNWDEGPKRAEEWARRMEEWEMGTPLNMNDNLVSA